MKNFEDYKKYYKNINEIFSPFLKEKVIFNSKGLNHILRKKGSKRTSKEILKRLENLENAVFILQTSTTIQEVEEVKLNEKKIIFYGFIAIVSNKKIKVIIRKDNNNFYFYSVIVDFFTSFKRDKIFLK